MENFAVSETGYGLSDFDDATRGPFLMDLLRFGTSIALAAQIRGWSSQTEDLLEHFLDGYVAGFIRRQRSNQIPDLVRRARVSFDEDDVHYLNMIMEEALIAPEQKRRQITNAIAGYISSQCSDGSHETAEFRVLEVRALQIGIGSLGKARFILRLRGPSDAPGDDRLLELKELSTTTSASAGCDQSAEPATRFDNIRVAENSIAEPPDEGIGLVQIDNTSYWAHLWPRRYRALDVQDKWLTVEDLHAIVYWVGVQLAHGHQTNLGAAEQQSILKTVRRERTRFSRSCAHLAVVVTGAWRRARMSN